MKVFVHSTNKNIDGKTLTSQQELDYAIYAKYNKSGFGRTHFDILDDETYMQLSYIYKGGLLFLGVADEPFEEFREIVEELESMLSEYKRYFNPIKTHLSSVYGLSVTGGNNDEE